MPLIADTGGRLPAPVPSGAPLPGDINMIMEGAMVRGAAGAQSPVAARPLSIRIGSDARVKVDAGMMGAEGLGQKPGVLKSSGMRQFSSIDEAVNSFYLMDDDYRKKVMERMYFYGLTENPNNEAAAADSWRGVVQMAWNYTQAGKDVDVMQLIPRLGAGRAARGPVTTTSRTFNTMDPENARITVIQALTQALGRDPHEAEVRNLVRGLQAGFADNPAITEMTQDRQGNTTTRNISQGFDPGAYIANQIQADPEAGAHQAAATLFPALMNALKSP